MKSCIFTCLLLGCPGLLAQSQDIPIEETPSLPTVEIAAKSPPATVISTARILGNIPDGTPPPPAPPKPPFVVAPQDILSTTTHQQGGRTITVREIQPIALPPPPAPPPAPAPLTPAQLERIDSYRATHPKNVILFLGATVYRSKNAPPRTLVRYWANGRGEAVTFWSSADFSLIAGGIHSFVDSASETHHILMGWGNVDIDDEAARGTTRRRLYQAPEIPALPTENAGFVIVGKVPVDASALVPIQSLHDLYNREYDRLLTAYQGRERARIQHEADLKANPPKPKNIILNYWRTETPAAPVKGGAK
jgi:hypothetical protein